MNQQEIAPVVEQVINKYNNGKVYKIVSNTTGQIYIGSTCVPRLCQRLAKHKRDYLDHQNGKRPWKCTSFEIIKNNDCRIELLENFPCNNVDELRKRERYYIENNVCVNKCIPGRTKKEYKQLPKYKEQQRIYSKEFEKIEERKIYKKDLNKKRLEHKIECGCGSITNKACKSTHEKTKKHKLWEESLTE